LAGCPARGAPPPAVQRRVLDRLGAERHPRDVDLEPGDDIEVALAGRADQEPGGAAGHGRPASCPARSGCGRSTVPPQAGPPAAFRSAICAPRPPGPTGGPPPPAPPPEGPAAPPPPPAP